MQKKNKIQKPPKSEQQKTIAYNIKMFYGARKRFINLFNDYVKIVSESNFEAIKGTGLKILTPKQMLQRLPIALAQLKAGNTSDNLLNEIRQIVY